MIMILGIVVTTPRVTFPFERRFKGLLPPSYASFSPERQELHWPRGKGRPRSAGRLGGGHRWTVRRQPKHQAILGAVDGVHRVHRILGHLVKLVKLG